MKKFIRLILTLFVFFTAVSYAEGDIDLNVTLRGAGVLVGVDNVSADDALVMILKPCDNADTDITEYVKGISESNFSDMVISASAVPIENGSFETELYLPEHSPARKYVVRVTFDIDFGDIFATDFYYMSENENKKVAESFMTADENGINDLLASYGNAFDNYDVSVLDAKYVKLAAGGFSKKLFDANAEITYISDLIRVFDTSEMIKNMLENNSGYKENIEKNKQYLSKLFDKNYDVNEFESIYEKVKAKITVSDAESFVLSVKRANALSLMLGGSYEDRERAITENAAELGITTDVSASGVSTIAIAKKISNTDISGYAGGMEAEIKRIIALLKSESGGSKPGGGSGGGSGGSVAAPGTNISIDRNYDSNTKPDTKDDGKKNNAKTFSDMAGFEWARAAAERLLNENILAGNENGEFLPENYLVREEASKIIVCAFNIEEDVESGNMFDDCDISAWYYPYIALAKSSGIVNGTSESIFGIGEYVTRQDLCVLIYRAAEKSGLKLAEKTSVEFSDYNSVSNYAAKAVSDLSNAGIITGFEDGTFMPHAFATRAETAVIIDRLLEGTVRKG